LTLFSVSRRSAEIFGHSSRFYVPHNLYYDLGRESSPPTICQILTLSHLTNYRLSDWLAVFGFDLYAISRLQLLIPRQRTTVLDSTVYDMHAWIPWFVERTANGLIPSIAPLGQLLALAPAKRAIDLLESKARKFLYAKVGDEDLYALPYFAPGSTVRVDTRLKELQFGQNAKADGRFFLVAHEFGWTCSQLIPLERDRVLLHCPQRPCLERELEIGTSAKILGVIDAEFRQVRPHRPMQMMPKSPALRKPRFSPPSGPASLKDLLRHARMSVGLSFREASSASRLIADTLSNEQYFAAASTLSDYETLAGPPRHVEKIISLCALYCIEFEEFLRASGLPLDRAGREPIPDEIIPRKVPGRNRGLRVDGQDSQNEPSGFLAALVNQWEEVPIFLRHSLDEIAGLKSLSFSDVFWVGGDRAQRHPLLVNAALVIVNRRARRPSPPADDFVCEEPLYLILKRDGEYLCGRCTLEKANLVVHGYPRGALDAQRFRDGTDAEVVGKITAILRRLL
jgi:hypothetical protein